jgi:hypothetical protein
MGDLFAHPANRQAFDGCFRRRDHTVVFGIPQWSDAA